MSRAKEKRPSRYRSGTCPTCGRNVRGMLFGCDCPQPEAPRMPRQCPRCQGWYSQEECVCALMARTRWLDVVRAHPGSTAGEHEARHAAEPGSVRPVLEQLEARGLVRQGAAREDHLTGVLDATWYPTEAP